MEEAENREVFGQRERLIVELRKERFPQAELQDHKHSTDTDRILAFTPPSIRVLASFSSR